MEFKPLIPDFAYKMVSFQFDDGTESDYNKAYQYLKTKNLQKPLGMGTSNINTNRIGETGYITWEQAREMRSNGWSFQCHLAAHYDGTQITSEQLHEQFQLVDKAFYNQGWFPPKYHVYPFGLWTPTTRDIALQYREVMVLDGVPGTNTTAFLNKKIKFKGSYGDIASEETFNIRKAEIDSIVAGEYNWITFLGHSIEDTPSGSYGWKTSYWQAFIDYVLAQGITIVSVEHGHRIQKFVESRWQN